MRIFFLFFQVFLFFLPNVLCGDRLSANPASLDTVAKLRGLENVSRPRRRDLELFPQLEDRLIDRPGALINRILPYRNTQLRTRDGCPIFDCESEQEIVLPW